MKLTNKVIVVTGGGSGIGRAMCQRFARDNPAAIIVSDRDAAGAKQTVDCIGAIASAMTTDVTDEAQIKSLVAEVTKKHGRIDLFCSNAGIAVGQDEIPGVSRRNDRVAVAIDFELHGPRSRVARNAVAHREDEIGVILRQDHLAGCIARNLRRLLFVVARVAIEGRGIAPTLQHAFRRNAHRPRIRGDLLPLA